MLSLPPEAPIATLSPGWKRLADVMVSATSDSKREMKHWEQIRALFFGLRICAREVLQISQVDGMMGHGTDSEDGKD